MFPDLFVLVNTKSCTREDDNGLPVCVAEGSDGTAELQEFFFELFLIIDEGCFFL